MNTAVSSSLNSPFDAKVKHRTIDVDGIAIFYREAGARDAPTVLLLHGFPSSSHEFRHLMPALADKFRLVAPDLPGFGFSAFPDRTRFPYSFDGFANLIDAGHWALETHTSEVIGLVRDFLIRHLTE